jgi:hypothetical protein
MKRGFYEPVKQKLTFETPQNSPIVSGKAFLEFGTFSFEAFGIANLDVNLIMSPVLTREYALLPKREGIFSTYKIEAIKDTQSQKTSTKEFRLFYSMNVNPKKFGIRVADDEFFKRMVEFLSGDTKPVLVDTRETFKYTYTVNKRLETPWRHLLMYLILG